LPEMQSQIQRPANARIPFGRAGVKLTPKTPSRSAKPASAVQPAAQTERAAEQGGSFEIGRVISRMCGVLGHNAVTFVALIALAAIPERAAVHLVGMESALAPSVSTIVLFFTCSFLQVAVTQAALSGFAGERPALGDCLAAALWSFFPALGLLILSSLGIAVAAILLVVPGILLALSWSMVLPVCVGEKPGVFACFGRSKALTKGHRGKIFLLALMLGIAAVVAGLLLLPLWGIGFTGPAGFLSDNWLVRLLLAAVSAAGGASVYHELCLVQEGGAPQQLAAAFD
jgi:hypothetical protein